MLSFLLSIRLQKCDSQISNILLIYIIKCCELNKGNHRLLNFRQKQTRRLTVILIMDSVKALSIMRTHFWNRQHFLCSSNNYYGCNEIVSILQNFTFLHSILKSLEFYDSAVQRNFHPSHLDMCIFAKHVTTPKINRKSTNRHVLVKFF